MILMGAPGSVGNGHLLVTTAVRGPGFRFCLGTPVCRAVLVFSGY